MSEAVSDKSSSLRDTLETSPTGPLIQLNCRVCYCHVVLLGCLIPLRSPFGYGKSKMNIREALLFCVPKITVQYTDHICNKCLKSLKITYSFIKTCLNTESQIAGLKEKVSVNILSQSLQDNGSAVSKEPEIELKIECEESKILQPVINEPIKNESKYLVGLDNDLKHPIYDEPNIIGSKTSDTLTENKLDEESNITGKLSKKIPDGKLELNDFSSKNTTCVVVKRNITEEETKDLGDNGINATSPKKKKKFGYVERDSKDGVGQCKHCSLTFCSEADLDKHMLAHKKGTVKVEKNVSVKTEIRKCPMCPAEFMAQAALSAHCVQVHNVKKPFVCPQCNMGFKSQILLNCHAKFTVEGEQRCHLKCPKCGKEFKQASEHEKHVAISEASGSCDIVRCKECREMMSRSILKEHRQNHQNSDSLLCSECGKFFPSASSLTRHFLLCHTKREEKFSCPKCTKLFSDKRNLKTHVEAVHEKKLHPCNQCSRKFTHRRYLQKHIRTQHNFREENAFSCDKCGLLFKTSSTLGEHIRYIHEKIKDFACDLCGEQFIRATNLSRHKKHHDLYIQNVCKICNTSFKCKWNLDAHMDAGHDEEGRPLKTLKIGYNKLSNFKMVNGKRVKVAIAKHHIPKVCPVCQKVLASAPLLRRHYRESHVKLLQRKCPKCECYFSTQGNLIRHLKNHDDPNYDLRCRICFIAQKSKSHLKKHLETVHKNRKYKCHICHKAFGRKHILTNHVLKQHPEESEKRRQEMDVLVNKELQAVPS